MKKKNIDEIRIRKMSPQGIEVAALSKNKIQCVLTYGGGSLEQAMHSAVDIWTAIEASIGEIK